MKNNIKICTACNGSGYYDNTGSPKCSCCRGLGIMLTHLPYRLWKHILVKYYNISKREIERLYEYEHF